MTAPRALHRFGDFVLDEQDKQLWRGSERVPLNPRYFDALALLVRNPGSLVSKDRFFDEVWSNVTVGDEALTQCIKSLRQALGDRTRDPAFIVTVPKHGYRFIAPVTSERTPPALSADVPPVANDRITAPFGYAIAGTLGGGLAGLAGGVVYGLGAAGGAGGAFSALIVLMALCLAVGLLGGLGVSAGMAAASVLLRRDWAFSIFGAAAGGLVIGGAFHIVGSDGLHLLFGRAPDHFTGGLEGTALGAALAAGARLGGGLAAPTWRPAIAASLCGAGVGGLISLAGGTLMAGSLAALAASFPSGLNLNAIGRLSGEPGFGPIAQAMAAAMEGMLFGLCVVGAILWRRRKATLRPASGRVVEDDAERVTAT